ncbi:Endocytosis and vacuole integrity protein [Allomyces javanicus]|nr:Endocytosis and vacuole integrity protein [Allomyces javanicus]
MSNLASFLQIELLNLANEARKRNPDIKDASERVTIYLRPLKDKPPADIANELAKNDEVLRPFLLACETKQPKLVSIAVGGIQRLVSHKAIADGPVTLRTVIQQLNDVSSVSMDVQLKLLQTLLPLFTQFRSIHMELVAQTLAICFRLYAVKDPLVSNTAAATLRQLVIFLFEKVSQEDGLEESVAADLGRVKLAPSSIESLRPCARDAFLVFQDLCHLASGTTDATFLGIGAVPKPFVLELLESILANNSHVFARHIELAHALSQSVCPLVIKTFSEKHDFSQTVRLMRVVHLLVHKFSAILEMECEVFLTLFVKTIDADQWWTRVLTLEVVLALMAQPELLRDIFRAYDLQKQSTNVLQALISALNKKVSGIQENVLDSTLKIQCLDQLDKSDPPSVPDNYESYLAVQCLLTLADSLRACPADDLTASLLTMAWSAVLASLSNLLKVSPAPVVPAIHAMAVACGRLHLDAPRDAFLTLLSRLATSDPNAGLAALLALLQAAIELIDSLGPAWSTVFETLCQWERARRPGGAQGAPAIGAGGAAAPVTSAGSAAAGNSGSGMRARAGMGQPGAAAAVSGEGAAQVEAQVKHLLSATRELSDEALAPVFTALCQFNLVATMSFAVDKLRQLVILHLHRLLTALPEQWTLVIQHFVFIASNRQSVELQLQACDTICFVATQGINVDQAKVLAPLKELADLTGDVAKRALQTLHSILQVHGQAITEWPLVYRVLQSAVHEDALVRAAFPLLELLCSEYLPAQPQAQCVETLRLYATQAKDVNIALTCVRLLWTISDASARDASWLHVQHQLQAVCMDPRLQVRNGCVTSLFRSVASTAPRLSSEVWHACLLDVVVPLLDDVVHCNLAAPALDAADAASLVVHHSRDTAEKQWDETRVLAMQGVGALVLEDARRGGEHVTVVLDRVVRYVLEGSLEVKVATAKVVLHLAEKPAAAASTASAPVEDVVPTPESPKPPSTLRAPLFKAWQDAVDGLLAQTAQQDPPPTLSLTLVDVLSKTLATFVPATLSNLADAPSTRTLLLYQSKLVDLLRFLPDHPNDAETCPDVQRAVLALTDQVASASANEVAMFLAQLIALPFQAPTGRAPTFRALARTAMTHAESLARTAPLHDAALATLVGALAAYLGTAHVLHDAAAAAFVAVVTHLCANAPVPDMVIANVARAAGTYLAARPNAFDADEERDVDRIQTLVKCLPPHLPDRHLAAFVGAVEQAASITVISALDAGVAAAANAFAASVADGAGSAMSPEAGPPGPLPTPVTAFPGNGPATAAPASAYPGSPSAPGSTMPRRAPRERVFTASLGALFGLAAQHPTAAAPVARMHARKVLARYVSDRGGAAAGMPVPRLRDVEVAAVLDQLANADVVRDLFLDLVDAVPAVARGGDAAALDALCRCLRRCAPEESGRGE